MITAITQDAIRKVTTIDLPKLSLDPQKILNQGFPDIKLCTGTDFDKYIMPYLPATLDFEAQRGNVFELAKEIKDPEIIQFRDVPRYVSVQEFLRQSFGILSLPKRHPARIKLQKSPGMLFHIHLDDDFRTVRVLNREPTMAVYYCYAQDHKHPWPIGTLVMEIDLFP